MFAEDTAGVHAGVSGRATPAPTLSSTRLAAQCHLRGSAVGRRRTLPVTRVQGSVPGHCHSPRGPSGHGRCAAPPHWGPQQIYTRLVRGAHTARGRARGGPGDRVFQSPHNWRPRREQPAVTRFCRTPAGQGLGRWASLPSSGGGDPGHHKDTRARAAAAGALPAAEPGPGAGYRRPRGLARGAAAAATAQRRRAAPSMTAMAAHSLRLKGSRV